MATLLGSRRAKITLFAILALGLLILAYFIRNVLNPLFIAALLAYILNPAVNLFDRLLTRGWMRKHQRLARSLAVFIIFILLFAAVGVVLAVAIPVTYTQTAGLISALAGDSLDENGGLIRDLNANGRFDPGYLERGWVWIIQRSGRFQSWMKESPARKEIYDEAVERIKANLAQSAGTIAQRGANYFSRLITGISGLIRGIVSLAIVLFLVIIYSFYLMHEAPRMRVYIEKNLPALYRERILDTAHKIHLAIASFFRGRLVVCLVMAIICSTGLFIFGVRFALVLGCLAAIANLIPYMLFTMTIPTCLFVYADYGEIWRVGGVLGVFIVTNLVGDVIIAPRILAKGVGLHPVIIILVLFIGGALFGLFGVLLAVPVASVIKILTQEFLLPEIKTLAREKPKEGE